MVLGAQLVGMYKKTVLVIIKVDMYWVPTLCQVLCLVLEMQEKKEGTSPYFDGVHYCSLDWFHDHGHG